MHWINIFIFPEIQVGRQGEVDLDAQVLSIDNQRVVIRNQEDISGMFIGSIAGHVTILLSLIGCCLDCNHYSCHVHIVFGEFGRM